MSFISRLFGKRTRLGPESIHVGHFAALGAKSALMLSQHGTRHTAMTREHLMWSGNDGGLRLVGWGNGQKIEWPDRAVDHLPDLKTFADAFGPATTAGLRFGYVYQLGPIGEWMFFAAARPEHTVPPPLWRTEWKPPSKDWSLGEDGMAIDLDHLLAIQPTDPVDAKRLQMARFLRGVISNDSDQEYSSLEDLARLYAREERPLRALALGTAVMTRPRTGDAAAEDSLFKLMVAASGDDTEGTQIELNQVVVGGQWSSLLELVWKLENVEIGAAITR